MASSLPNPTHPSLRLGFTDGVRAAFASVWGSMLLIMLGSMLGTFPLVACLDVPLWMWPVGLFWLSFAAVMACLALPFPGWILVGIGVMSLWAAEVSEDYRLEAKMGLFYSSLLGGWMIGFLLWQPLIALIAAVSFHLYLRLPLVRYFLQPRLIFLPPDVEGIQFKVSCPCCERHLDSVTLRKHPSRFFCPGCGRKLKIRSE